MINGLWLLTLIPAALFGFGLCYFMCAGKSDTRFILEGLQKPTWTVTEWPKFKPCDCGATMVHLDITGLWWQCAKCGKRLEEEA
jgi:hypothetical protein